MKVLYLDCFSGISGDMALGALIDAGADFLAVKKELQKLNLETEYELSWQRVVRCGISAVKIDVLHGDRLNGCHVHRHGDHHGDDEHHGDEHRENYRERVGQHGPDGHRAHRSIPFRSHGEENRFSGDHAHPRHHHHSVHRHYRDIVRIIEKARLSNAVTAVALSIFEAIGRAEAKIHGIPLEKVHFHEVGAVDSIIDIVGTAVCLEMLNIEKVFASPVAVGGGFVRIDHGMYPVPAPATLEMLRGMPLRQTDREAELTTPTGAGILSALAKGFGPVPSMKVEHIGYGAGTNDFPERPNVLRALVGELC